MSQLSDKKDAPSARKPPGDLAGANLASKDQSSQPQAVPPGGYEEVAFTAASIPAESKGIPHAYDDIGYEGEASGRKEADVSAVPSPTTSDLNPNLAYNVSQIPDPSLLHTHDLFREEELNRSEGDYQYPNVVQGKRTDALKGKFLKLFSSSSSKQATEEPERAGNRGLLILAVISIVVAVIALTISIAALGVSTSKGVSSAQRSQVCMSTVVSICIFEDFCETPAVSSQDVGIVSSILGCTVSAPPAQNGSYWAALLSVAESYSCQCGSTVNGDVSGCNLVSTSCYTDPE